MKKTAISLALALTLCLALTACESSSRTGPDPENSEKAPPIPVTVVLDYLPNTNHTGIYAARDLGYYAELGLDVTILEPADNTVTTLIATGNGDFGISYQEDVTYARAADEPLPIRAVATIIQHNTSAFATYAPKEILRPRDFEGKVYAGWGSPAEEAVIAAIMKADGADPAALTYVSSGGGYAALTRNVDIMWFFRAWDGIFAAREDVPVNYIDLAEFDARLDYYTPVIIASEAFLAEHPDTVRAFLGATRRGYEYAVANPGAAAEILYRYAPEYELDALVESQTYLAGQFIADAPQWGVMQESVWSGYTEFMTEYGLIASPVAPEDCMTNEFWG
ncbi:MAG: ABC transporter substrate-binding protein [Oscillospiraceae bacterium]|nr:ABC transporter substrate-binding protein [Oscillospiraceae bacterium]